MRRIAKVLAGLLVSSLLSACAAASTPVTQSIAVPATIDRSAAVNVTMSSGGLRIAGGAAALVEGTATYPSTDGKVRLGVGSRESTAGKVTTVDVSQGDIAPLTTGERRLDLTLNGGLPIDLAVRQGSGDTDLDLRLADAKDLDVTAKSGGLGVRLTGPHPSLSHASFDLASGDTSIAADGEYPALESFAVRSGSGNVRLNLAGTWHKSFMATVDARSGNVILVLPRTVNVRVIGSPGSGNTSAVGFTQAGEGWERTADKPSESTVTVEVTLTSGNLTIEVPPAKS